MIISYRSLDFFHKLVFDQIHEGVAEEAIDIASEELHTSLATQLVQLNQLVAPIASDQSNIEFLEEVQFFLQQIGFVIADFDHGIQFANSFKASSGTIRSHLRKT